MELTAGLAAEVDHEVTDADTAQAVGSGDVPVLGTPRLLALAEAATVAALRGRLDPASTSVGIRVSLDHLAASRVGARVRVVAYLVEVDGRRLRFDVRAWHPDEPEERTVARGEVERVVVSRERFLAAAGAAG